MQRMCRWICTCCMQDKTITGRQIISKMVHNLDKYRHNDNAYNDKTSRQTV